ncbi:MAG: divalent cation tolerance protein CutA [Vulcanimicrobiota bacterium]
MRLVISACIAEETDKITDALLSERLIGSVSIIENVKTKVWWKGDMLTQTESILIMRTREELVWKVERRLLELNSYEVPEVAAIEMKEWNNRYAKWLYEVTEPPK